MPTEHRVFHRASVHNKHLRKGRRERGLLSLLFKYPMMVSLFIDRIRLTGIEIVMQYLYRWYLFRMVMISCKDKGDFVISFSKCTSIYLTLHYIKMRKIFVIFQKNRMANSARSARVMWRMRNVTQYSWEQAMI